MRNKGAKPSLAAEMNTCGSLLEWDNDRRCPGQVAGEEQHVYIPKRWLAREAGSSCERSSDGLAIVSRRFESGIPASGIVQGLTPYDYDDSTARIQTNSIELLDTPRPFRRLTRSAELAR